MDDFFHHNQTVLDHDKTALPVDAPLSSRMRPRTIDEYVGQQHLISKGKLLRRAIDADRIASMIFYGPPGTGKTSLARVIAQSTKSHFIELSGVNGTVADLRKAISIAQQKSGAGKKTLLFIDEIHRFNKAQQDALLPDVERGILRLIGATTQNPYFSIIPPLLSRSQIFKLEPLSVDDLVALQYQAIAESDRGLGKLLIDLEKEAATHLATVSDGDARKCLNALEIAAMTTKFSCSGRIVITRAIAEESIQQKAVVYDATGDAHYDVMSAFIKSVRGSDPDAAIYWLAIMLHAGEDPRFIARRLVILASEDISLADYGALPLAVAAKETVEFIGMPEARITLAHATIYLARAPKSNSAYMAIDAALGDVRKGRTMPVPLHLRDGHYQGAASFGHGKGYQYPHDFADAKVKQDYLPEARCYYQPTPRDK